MIKKGWSFLDKFREIRIKLDEAIKAAETSRNMIGHQE